MWSHLNVYLSSSTLETRCFAKSAVMCGRVCWQAVHMATFLILYIV